MLEERKKEKGKKLERKPFREMRREGQSKEKGFFGKDVIHWRFQEDKPTIYKQSNWKGISMSILHEMSM